MLRKKKRETKVVKKILDAKAHVRISNTCVNSDDQNGNNSLAFYPAPYRNRPLEHPEVDRWSRNMLNEAIKVKTLFNVPVLDGHKCHATLLHFSQKGIGVFAFLDQPQSGSDQKPINCSLTFMQLVIDQSHP